MFFLLWFNHGSVAVSFIWLICLAYSLDKINL
jgi:arginine exporter protein ArgO